MKEFKTKWVDKDMIPYLDEFNDLYNQRPIKQNDGGMKSPHMFPSWFIIKQLKPKFIVESGVWKGLGTWFFEQASPESKIISIDPAPTSRTSGGYTSPRVTYQTKDFLLSDWSHLPKEDTFLFFDDHQNFMERLKYAHKLGFKKVMTEDNYPYQQGDCYTPKKILANCRYVIDKHNKKTWFNPNTEDREFFEKNVKIYQEMPPIFKDEKTRWGDNWDNNYPTPKPLLSNGDSNKYSLFFSEKKDYTWICYIEMN